MGREARMSPTCGLGCLGALGIPLTKIGHSTGALDGIVSHEGLIAATQSLFPRSHQPFRWVKGSC